jgi:hypothetical protein
MENKKTELVNDLISVITVLEEIWKYHPDNPDKLDIITEYNQLLKIQGDIENELKSLS